MTELLLACAYENKIDDFQQLPNLGFERRGNARKKLFFWFPLGEGQGRDVAQGFTVNCLLNRSLMNFINRPVQNKLHVGPEREPRQCFGFFGGEREVLV